MPSHWDCCHLRLVPRTIYTQCPFPAESPKFPVYAGVHSLQLVLPRCICNLNSVFEVIDGDYRYPAAKEGGGGLVVGVVGYHKGFPCWSPGEEGSIPLGLGIPAC